MGCQEHPSKVWLEQPVKLSVLVEPATLCVPVYLPGPGLEQDAVLHM